MREHQTQNASLPSGHPLERTPTSSRLACVQDLIPVPFEHPHDLLPVMFRPERTVERLDVLFRVELGVGVGVEAGGCRGGVPPESSHTDGECVCSLRMMRRTMQGQNGEMKGRDSEGGRPEYRGIQSSL